MLNTKITIPPLAKNISDEGINDFYWPISFKEISNFGRNLEYQLSDFLKNYPDQEKILSYKVLIKHYVCDVCGVFQAELFRQRVENTSHQIDIPKDWLFFPYALKEQAPPYPPILQSLKNIKVAPSLLKRLMQPKRIFKIVKKIKPFEEGGIKVDGLYLSKINSENLEKDIIATQRTELISMHAQRINRKVYLCRSDRWFSPVSENDIKEAQKYCDDEILSSILNIIFNLADSFDVKMKDYAKNHLEDLLRQFFGVVYVHRERLSRREDIPQEVWTGTSGQIWDIMLRLETLKRGGIAIAHDHSGDRAHANNFEMGWIEMYGATKFATYSKKQAHSLENNIKSWPILDKVPPQIIAVGDEKKLKPVNYQENANNKIKKILLFSTVYDRDHGRGNPIFPMVSYMDWQIRLISKLNKWGYEVYFKPHPESLFSTPKVFETELKATIVNGRFEDMTEEMDMYLFDFTQTSVFKPAILSNKPVVIVDFKGLDWNEGARDLLEKRADILEGHFDDTNRVQIDWVELESAIKNSVNKRNNREFIEKYYY